MNGLNLDLKITLAAPRGWLRVALTVILGMLAATAFPDLGWIPLFFVGVLGFLLILRETKGARTAFELGWCFGLGYFAVGLYWISFALAVDWEQWWWLVPFSLLGLPAVLALATGVASLGYYWGQKYLDHLGGALLFATLWGTCEWIRGHILGGFPWQLTGYIWTSVPEMLQLTSIVGVYGLGLLTIVVAVLPAGLIPSRTASDRPPPPSRRNLIILLIGWATIAGVWGYGSLRLAAARDDSHQEVVVILVQPVVSQEDKWDHRRFDEHFRLSLTLTEQAVSSLEAGLTSIVVWPEAASQFFLEEDDVRRRAIASTGADLFLIGGFRRRVGSLGHWRYWNSMLVIDAQGNVIDAYDKTHLVPFGEYFPFRDLLPTRWRWARAIAANLGAEISAGEGIRTLAIGDRPSFSPLICYEAIFPHRVIDRQHRPDWLVNISNDAWYGRTSGPYQHFEQSRVRAIEEGLPMVRVANNGISGVVDAYGRVLDYLDLDERGTITARLPRPLPTTIYSHWGDLLYGLMTGVLLGLIIGLRTRPQTQDDRPRQQ